MINRRRFIKAGVAGIAGSVCLQPVQANAQRPEFRLHVSSGQVGPLIGPCAFSSLAASRHWLDSDMARAFTRAYAAARQFLNETPAREIAALEQKWFARISPDALTQCIASYQQLGCWTPHLEITRAAFEVTLDVFEFTGGIPGRYAYEQVCAVPPSI